MPAPIKTLHAALLLVVGSAGLPPRTTPPPCGAKGPCPYYAGHPQKERYYEVYVQDRWSFVYQSVPSSKCGTANKGCAHTWNVKSQSFTTAGVDFSAGPVHIKVETGFGNKQGKLGGKKFVSPRVVSRFNHGKPTTVSSSSSTGEYVFSVTEPGQYSVELFGSDLTDPLLIFLNDLSDEAEDCPSPGEGGKQLRFWGPGVNSTHSWKNTGYYAWTRDHDIELKENDVVCIERGAFVQGGFTGFSAKNVTIQGYGLLSGNPFEVPNEPAGNTKALLYLCGDNIRVSGVTLVSALGSNININFYWSPCKGKYSGASIRDVKMLSTWWFSDDGPIAGPRAHVHDSFVMVNDDALKPMQSDQVIEDNTVWQGTNGWSVMVGWNTGRNESGMIVRNIHVIHTGHHSDGYCYPCNPSTCQCAQEGQNGYCGGSAHGYGGTRASIGMWYGEPGTISNVQMKNILVTGPYVRAFSFGVENNCFAQHGALGSIRNFRMQDIIFDHKQKTGLHSKIWAVGSGSAARGDVDGTVYNFSFVNVSLGGEILSKTNHAEHFAIGQAAHPKSKLGGNVDAVTFDGADEFVVV